MKSPLRPPLLMGSALGALLFALVLAGCQSSPEQAEPAYLEGASPLTMRLNPIVWGTLAHFDIVSVDGKPTPSKVHALVPPGRHTIVIHTVTGLSDRANTASVTMDFRPGGNYRLRPTYINGLAYALVMDNDNGTVAYRPNLRLVQVEEASAPPPAAAPAAPAPLALAPVQASAAAGAAPAGASTELAIWPGVAPGSEGATAPETWQERGTGGVIDRAVRQVSRPTLTVYLPPPALATGVAVLVAPGGGFEHVTIDKEGNDVARWLASQGIAGMVLKYRLPRTPGRSYTIDTAMADAMQALKVIRDHASEWQVDPAKLGMMGFSAGGGMTARAAVWPDASLRPKFVVLMYSGAPAGWKKVPPDAPPAFLAQADDDPLGTANSIRFYQLERDRKIPAELHLFSKGGHGFGLGKPGTPTVAWPGLFRNWLAASGFLSAQP